MRSQRVIKRAHLLSLSRNAFKLAIALYSATGTLPLPSLYQGSNFSDLIPVTGSKRIGFATISAIPNLGGK
jgi:hypothetical protein